MNFSIHSEEKMVYSETCKEIEEEHGKLFTSAQPAPPSLVEEWTTTWLEAFNERTSLGLAAPELIRSGRLLARVAESFTMRRLADQLFLALETLVSELDPSELQLVEILIDTGELDRRLGRLESALGRFNRASEVAERPDTPAAHKLRSRIFYEFAYLDFYAGDADAATRRLALSELEANQAGDGVGAAIARALTALCQIEEGAPAEALQSLRAESANFVALANSPEVKRANRDVFANRWRMNCEMHEIQALLAGGEVAAARRAVDRIVNSPNPSVAARSTLYLIDACVALSEGDLDRANASAQECGLNTPSPKEKQESHATLLSLKGTILLAGGSFEDARSQFQTAMNLDPLLRNARGQGWASLGLAILFQEDANTAAALEILDIGIARCARCCAPVRCALQAFRTELVGAAPAAHDWRATLMGLIGPLPPWLLRGAKSP